MADTSGQDVTRGGHSIQRGDRGPSGRDQLDIPDQVIAAAQGTDRFHPDDAICFGEQLHHRHHQLGDPANWRLDRRRGRVAHGGGDSSLGIGAP